MILSRLSEHLKYFLTLSVLPLFFYTLGIIILSLNDDFIIWQMLINGESRVLILSYPLSQLLVILYKTFSSISWYSLLLISILSINMWFMSKYLAEYTKNYTKSIVILFMIINAIYWLSISMTLVTFSLITTSILFIRNDFKFFILLLTLATFLRNDFFITLLPIIILPFIIFYRFPLTKKHLISIVLFCILLSINYTFPRTNQQYTEWLSFNSTRAYFADLKMKVNDPKNKLTEAQEEVLNFGWYMNDETLLPTSTVKEFSGSTLQATIEQFSLHHLPHRAIILVIFISFIYIGIQRKKYFVLYLALFLFIIAIISIRDVERTTLPLLFLLIMVLIESGQIVKVKPFFIIIFSFMIIAFAVKITPYIKNNLFAVEQNLILQKEFINLVNNSNLSYEVSLEFPFSMVAPNQIMIANKLLDEKHWIHFSKHHILISGWLVRHPYFYQTHHISNKNHYRKYNTYYEFLTAPSTVFIGGKESTATTAHYKAILKAYDEKYNSKRKNCSHAITLVKTTTNFTLSKFSNQCKKSKDIHDSLQSSPANQQ